MKKWLRKVLSPIILSLICGSVCGKLVYQIYDRDIKREIKGEKIYLIQAGAYSTYDNMVDNTMVNNYVYYEDDGLYKAIVGITENYNNVEKIKKSYGKNVVVTEYNSLDEELNKKISDYDKKIEESNNKEDIQKIALEMLTLYKDKDNSTLVKIIS